MESSTNFIQLLFVAKAVLTFLPGLLTNYAEQYLPQSFLQIFRYGRANVSKKEDQGQHKFIKKIEVPKKWFYHVYIYGMILQPIIIFTVVYTYQYGYQSSWLKSLLLIVTGNARGETVNATTTTVAVVLFMFQLSRRLYETCFVCVYSNTKMNILHYFLTWTHYTGCMLTLPAYGPIFSGVANNSRDLTVRLADVKIYQYLAILLFLFGSWVQYQAHIGLASLRKGNENKTVSLKHQIPRGGMFELISCPNYLGEILVYTAFALLFKVQNSTWNVIALWVIANQVTTGVMNHKWYQATFRDYPKNRKAVIPYVW